MKPLTTVFLGASLVLNATLAYTAFSGRARLADSSAPLSAADHSTLNPSRSTAAPGLSPVDPTTWSKLQTDDLPALVARLRAAGFPPELVRAIMTGVISDQFAARQRALDPNAADRAFWKDRAPDTKLQLAQHQLYYEQQKVLRDLLGPDARSTDPLTLARERAKFGSLSAEKMDAAQQIVSDFDRKRTELYYTKGTMNSADLAVIDREQRTALTAVLSPSELEDFDLRSSRTGQSMRRELASFNPTEEEFRAIYKLRVPFDEKYSNSDSGIPSQEQMSQRGDAQKQLVNDVRTLLGAERAADYERSIDYNYQRTAQLVARLELPPETTVALWKTQKEFEQRRTDLYRTAGALTPEARTQQLTALQQEAVAKITPLLGGSASRVEAYKQYGGSWLTYLVPRPAPPR